MKHVKRLLLFLLLGLPVSLYAQVSDLNGIVRDESGEPLIGVSVVVKGAQPVR